MPLVRSAFPLKPLIDDTYTRVVSLNSSAARQDYVDYTLSQSVDPAKCVAVVNRKIGFYLSTSHTNYSLGLLAELINANTMRLWVGGKAIHSGGKTYSFQVPVVIYEFGRKPKRIETVRSAANGVNESVSLSSAVDLSKSVIIGGSVGQLHYLGLCYFQSANAVFLYESIGCVVVEF